MLARTRLLLVPLALGSLSACVSTGSDAPDPATTESALRLESVSPSRDSLVPVSSALASARVCPADAPSEVEIRTASQLPDLIAGLQRPNTTVLLGPNLVFDLSNVPLPLRVGPCVTMKSVAAFPPRIIKRPPRGIDIGDIGVARTAAKLTVPHPLPKDVDVLEVDWRAQSARTAHSSGPLFKFGTGHGSSDAVFAIECPTGELPASDNVSLSGFRLEGPSLEGQSASNNGIAVTRCLNVELSNLEVYGFGNAAISVEDWAGEAEGTSDGPGQAQGSNEPGDRIGDPEQVRIFGNYIHHNQHPSIDGHAAGYGVVIGSGAWAEVYENVFDFNRHAISSSWDAGGYNAHRNLVLKGGGVNDSLFHTHQLDMHGHDDPVLNSDHKGGQAGVRFSVLENSVQYIADDAVYVRGTPDDIVVIDDNVFAHPGIENSTIKSDAIRIWDRDDVGRSIIIGPNNVADSDSYLRSNVCDFDGDGIDDLFLATGRTWWFSGMGEFPWTYLSARHETIDRVRLGYFDADNKCDVITESGGKWWMASGGVGDWQDLGSFGVPLSDARFGRFDPSQRDHRAGVTKRTTHAFSRGAGGEWNIRGIFGDPDWHYIGGSNEPLSELNFGDFDGDGVTDILGRNGGKWAFSSAGRSSWTPLNNALSDNPGPLLIADLANDNIDDVLRMEVQVGLVGTTPLATFTWWVSDDGRGPWRKYWSTTMPYMTKDNVSVKAFVGRFGVAPGAGVLLTSLDRRGLFYSDAESARGASPSWTSSFFY